MPLLAHDVPAPSTDGPPAGRWAAASRGWRWALGVLGVLAVGAGMLLPCPAAAAERDWTTVRVAEELHPVRSPLLASWQQSTARAMAGPGASVWFREPAARMDVALQLSELDRRSLPHAPALRDRALDAALAGSTIGAQRALRTVLARSETLGAVHGFVRGLVAPSLRVDQSRSGGARLRSDDAAGQNAEVAFAQLDQGGPRRGLAGPPPPSFRTGSAIGLFPVPDTGSVTTAPPARAQGLISPSMSLYLQAENLVVDGARLQTRVVPRGARLRRPPAVQWTAMARQDLVAGLSLVGEAQGDRRQLRPRQLRTALDTRVPGHDRWIVRASVARIEPGQGLDGATDAASLRLASSPGLPTVEHRLELSLRADLRWRLPADVRAPPRGQVPGTRGRPMPELPPLGPNVPAAFVARSPVSPRAATIAAPAPGTPAAPDARSIAAR